MPRLCVPLSTLRPHPYEPRRMTRGQNGALLLSCAALSSATPYRFIPALSRLPCGLELFAAPSVDSVDPFAYLKEPMPIQIDRSRAEKLAAQFDEAIELVR